VPALARYAFVVLLLAAAPAAFAQYENCFECRTIVQQDGSVLMYCVTPPALIYGSQFCEVGELDTDRYYCSTWGNTCCNDPI
jgi:hypothetical protein